MLEVEVEVEEETPAEVETKEKKVKGSLPPQTRLGLGYTPAPAQDTMSWR